MTKRILSILAPFALLAGCGDDRSAQEDQGGEAAGEVLGGTISDDMLPLDKLTSTSPPEQSAQGDEAGPDAGGTSPATPDEGSEAGEPAPETQAADDQTAED